MTLPDFVAQLETRYGSAGDRAGDARSPESRSFEQAVRHMISSDAGSGSLVERGLVSTSNAGTIVSITQPAESS